MQHDEQQRVEHRGAFSLSFRECVLNRDAVRAYICIAAVYAAYGFVSHLITNFEDMVEDMETALEVERPVRTRSELASIPVFGLIFQAVCDLSDFVSFNTGMAKKYVPVVPVVMAAPAVISTVSGLRSLLLLPTAVMALVRVDRG